VNLLSLDLCDRGITPTEWQHRLHPPQYHPKISVVHDGIDTARVRPDAKTAIELPDSSTVRLGDEVVTYVNRQLEPFRGLFTFVEAAEKVARKRPHCRFLVVGKESGRYYGEGPPKGTTFKDMAEAKLSAARDRLHFLGPLPYENYLNVLQVSAAHVYLTRPFVLSWSMLEAMAAGCLVIASATPPVVEVIEDDRNGLLVDFFSADELAERLEEALKNQDRMKQIRKAARQTVIERYELSSCLQRQLDLVRSVVRGGATSFQMPAPLAHPEPDIARGAASAISGLV
jgi:glycosyltransferase involved in cell wall biosynthesis